MTFDQQSYCGRIEGQRKATGVMLYRCMPIRDSFQQRAYINAIIGG